MSFLDFPGLQYFYNKYLKPIKPHAREETIKSYTVNEQGHVPDAQLVVQLKEENESLQAKVEALNSALAEFRKAEALHTETITEAKSYTLEKSITDYKLIEIIMQYGSSNWITTRLFRSSTLSQFPNIMDSTKTSILECYYNMYISGKSLNVGAISSNTRILIRGIN